MKRNTQKLLVWLWAAQAVGFTQVPIWHSKALLSDLSEGGFRSLRHHLEQEALIRQEQISGTGYLSLTSHGQRAIEGLFPALSSERQAWHGEWTMLVFLKAPVSDPQFRYLRELILKHRAVALSRGVYLYPGPYPEAIIETCFQLYRVNVTVTMVKTWQFGDERRLINELFMLSDVVTALSGISTELNALLDQSQLQLKSGYQPKQPIHLVFDRMVSILEFDLGISRHYYPQTPTAVTLLKQIAGAIYPPTLQD